MTVGNPIKQVAIFAIPILLGNWFQNLYNIIDSIIVGRYLGVDALASVGMTGSIAFLVIGWIVGLTNGFGILISQAVGAREEKRLRHLVAMSAYICVAFAIAMTVGLIFANEWILELMNTPDTIFENTKKYIGIIYAGIPISILYNMLASISRGLGDSRTPLYFLIISSVLNVILDFAFIVWIPFGVAGAAYATVLSQTVSAVLCFIYIYRKYPQIRFTREDAKYNNGTIMRLMIMGIPMALQFSITAVGTMIVQGALNKLGAVYIAAFTSSTKIQNILIQIPIAIGAALANFTGQNYGANRLDRVKKGVSASLILVTVYSILSMAFAYFVAPNTVTIFADDPSGELVAISSQYFHIALWFYVPLGIIFVFRNTLQGLGNGIVPMIGGICELLARGLTVFLLFDSLKFVGVCLAEPFAWISALIPLIPYYIYYMRKVERE